MPQADFVDRGRQLCARGQYQEAVKVCRLGLLAHPTEVEGRLVLGEALFALNRYDEVLAEMRVALELDGENPRALGLKGASLLRKGDVLQSYDVLARAVTASPGDPTLHELYGEARRLRESAHMQSTSGGLRSGWPSRAPVHELGRPPSGFGGGRLSSEAIGSDDPDGEPVQFVSGSIPDRQRGHDSEPSIELSTRDLLPGGIPTGHELIDGPFAPRPSARIPPLEAPVDRQLSGLRPKLPRPGSGSWSASSAPAEEPPPRQGMGPIGGASGAVSGAAVPGTHSRSDEDMRTIRQGLGLLPDGSDPPRSSPRGPWAVGSPTPGTYPASGPSPHFPTLRGFQPASGPGAAFHGVPGADPATGGRGGHPGTGPGGPPAAGPGERAGPGPAPGSNPAFGAGASAAVAPGPYPGGPAQYPAAGPGAYPAMGPGSQPGFGAGGYPPAPQAPGPPFGGPPPSGAGGWQPPDNPRSRRRRGGQAGRFRSRRPSAFRSSGPLSRLPLIAFVVIALLVIGGGVLAGFELREMRLSGQIATAEAEADRAVSADTYTGYLMALDTYERIVAADDDDAYRAAQAAMAARMAAEVGDGLDQARQLVSELGQESSQPDALAARGFLALAEEDAERASAAAATLRQHMPEHPDSLYLAGRAALLSGRPSDAAGLLRSALDRRPRPGIAVALARAEANQGYFTEARTALDRALQLQPGHPAALIWGARIAVSARSLPSGAGEPESGLEAVIHEAAAPPEEQAVGVSPCQAAWSALALAEVKLARGERAASLDAVRTAQAARTRGGFAYHSALAEILAELGETDAARAQVELVLQEWPKTLASRTLEARVALASGDPGLAVAALDKAGDLTRYPEALALRGRARLAAGAVDQAAVDLDAALALRPDQQSAILARAEVDLARGDTRVARRRLARLYGNGKAASLEVATAYAGALRQSGERGEARKVLADLAQRRPSEAGDWRILIERARLLRGEGSWREAAEQYGTAIAAAPRALEAQLEAASLALDIGQLASARAQLDALVGEAPRSSLVLVEAARVRILSGDHRGAAELLDRAAALPSPTWKEARERGRLLLRQRRPELAVVELERAKGMAPRDGENRILLMEAYFLGKNRRAAARELVEVTKSFRRTSLLVLARGMEALVRERWRDGAEELSRAYIMARENGEPPRVLGRAAYWTGRALYLNDKGRRAIEWLDGAIAHDPSLADAQYLLGQISFETGKQDQAVKRFQKAVSLDPAGNPPAWYFLGEHYLAQGRKNQAREALQTYLERWPQSDFSADARSLLAKIK